MADDEQDKLDLDAVDESSPEVELDESGEIVVDPEDHNLAFESVERRRSGSWRWVRLTVLVLLLGGGGAWGWIGWGQNYFSTPGDEVPFIRAAEGPTKERPKVPGGLDVPNRDKLVYDRLEAGAPAESPRAETLLPRPEVPLPPPTAIPTPAPPVTVTRPPVEVEDSSPPVPKTETPTPEEVIAASRPTPAPKPPVVKAPVAEPGTVAKVAVAKSAPSSSPKAAKPPSGGYRIQLAAVRSESAARSEWARLRGQHRELLGKLNLNVVRADLGKKGTFFRLRAGSLPDQASARSLCEALTKKKVGCLVVRPGG